MDVPKIQVDTNLLVQEITSTRQDLTLPISQYPFGAFQPMQPLVQCCDKAEMDKPTEVSLETSCEIKSSSREKDCIKNVDIKITDCAASADLTGSGDLHIPVISLSHSISDRTCCRICQEDDTSEKFISPCFCTGSVGFMHSSCLEKWLQTNCRTTCELCSYPFPVQKVMPSVWKHLRHPAQNMDMPSLLCDISCFFLLTPLLAASTYLCSIGVNYYQGTGKSESVFAVATLMISLITVYCAWAALAVLYHRRVWLTWREKNSEIRMLMGTKDPLLQRKDLEDTDLEVVSNASDSCGITSRQESTSVLLRPIMLLTKSNMLRMHNSVANLNIVDPPNNAK